MKLLWWEGRVRERIDLGVPRGVYVPMGPKALGVRLLKRRIRDRLRQPRRVLPLPK